MSRLYRAARPLLFALPPERAHRLTICYLESPLVPPRPPTDPPNLAVTVFGRTLSNPIGLAAGFDKDAEAPGPMLRLGFGFVEVGTLTPRPQTGNLRPRVFRLVEDEAVINRLGFNNKGHGEALARLAKRRGGAPAGTGLVGVNLGANKDAADRIEDYVIGLATLGPYADYIAVNISSPNTPGLRGLQEREPLERLTGALAETRRSAGLKSPILIKIAPDLDDDALAAVVGIVENAGLDGLIISNTTISRPSLCGRYANEAGGLSGKPLFSLSTQLLAKAARLTEGRLTLIGTGGVSSGADAYAKIRAGATLVQLYTALIYHGPGVVTRIKQELAALLARDGFASVTEARGADLK